MEIRPTITIKPWLKFPALIRLILTGTNNGEHFFHVSQKCLLNKNKGRERISIRGKTLVTAGNMFLMVVHSQQRGRQMPLVKHSYLFCPWKWLKSNKGILNKEKQDLMPSPVFFCLRRLCPPSLWGHDWRAVYSQSHTIGILSSGRTLQLRSGVRNPTKTRDAAKFILKKVQFHCG